MREPRGLLPSRAVLPNWVTVLAKANDTTPAVTVLASVLGGAFADPPGYEGTAALVARVLDRGTQSRSADAIADDLENRGATMQAAATRHQISVTATCLSEDFAAVLDLIADMLRLPAFPDAEVQTRRTDLITSIRQQEDNPEPMAVDAMMRALYASHPYARKVRGTVPSVERLDRRDLLAFHDRWFTPTGLTVIVVGDIAESAAIDAVASTFAKATVDRSTFAKATVDRSTFAHATVDKSTFADATVDKSTFAEATARSTFAEASARSAFAEATARQAAAAVPDAPMPSSRELVSVPMMNKAQADVAYGFVGIRRSDPDYTAVSVMNNALGQYAIGGRLGDSIRERQGMAYYVFSSLEAGLGPGPLMIRAGVAAENVERTIASIDEELTSIRRDGFTAKEVDESKRYLIGSLPRQLETNAAIATFLLTLETYGLGLDYDLRVPGLLNQVTLEHANAAARRLFDPARATIAVAGPWTPTSGEAIRQSSGTAASPRTK